MPRGRPRTRTPEARRKQLVDAAVRAFGSKGLRATTVADIVQTAGVAKGTFYLYFATKDDIVNAVADRLIQRVADHIEMAARDVHRSAVEQITALGEALMQVGGEPFERDLIEITHRADNHAVHERMSEQVIARLRPTLEKVVADGIDAGAFCPQDPRFAAAFVLGTFSQLHDLVVDPDDLPAATTQLHAFVLRGLGYVGEVDSRA